MSSSSVALPIQSILNKAFRDSGRPGIVKLDVFPVQEGEQIRLTFESANAEGRHGVWLMTDHGVVVNGVKSRSVDLWIDTAPAVVDIAIHTEDQRLHLYNIWGDGAGRNSQAWTSGMLVEELPEGRRYKCNDIGLQGNFESLVFRLERVKDPATQRSDRTG
jgi:hypothetical protein